MCLFLPCCPSGSYYYFVTLVSGKSVVTVFIFGTSVVIVLVMDTNEEESYSTFAQKKLIGTGTGSR